MAAKRPIEDFFCNPTHNFAMEEHPRYSVASEPVIVGSPTMPPNEMFSFKAGIKTPEPSAAIRHFTDEPMFWRGYTSEEEVASPIDTDSRSFRTTSTFSIISQPASRLSEASFPEQLAQSCERVERQCERAQAVTLVPAGKVKVVSMPRLVDVSATPRTRRPAPITPIRPPVSRMSRMGISSLASSQASASPRTSTEKSPVSTAPNSVAALLTRGRSVRPRPSLPNLQATTRFQSGIPHPESRSRVGRTADFLQYDPYPSLPSEQPTTPPPVSPSRRRLHKLGSSFALNVFGMKRTNSSDSSLGDLEAVKEPEPAASASPPPLQPLARTSSAKPKMVARGANERAPPLVLPPCPETYEDERDLSRWPLRKDSSILGLPSKLHKRQRSMSAALVSVQA
ncbi:hypothetical protein LTR91_003616 [Friedmanniomyces endolithicus]|uniref:Uncharacterized protein n=1 Tax=Friedmanniomyces endolithicus TaxID=329885 RepID=A0A4U0TYW2_9PEZI|nr:hypothetical protein LTS09_001308 [Friedmanniomyces endolithicus]KAK0291914.1 hypothetical protein LTR35_001342 [Friedmanniomyces endolithicus]KAK0297828.1 hypothetical protein LTS00_003366 [Friedmanniomyces endolithicus]KAK0309917.1 hypothetical protein LTR01_004115 [Friedmanniomyces endolithicus]KAK0317780.1 hypothetical protein LTR82_011298 [Friedmanniomyces endolithicus]